MLSAPDLDRAFCGVRHNQTRDVVISLQFIPKSVAVIIDVFFHSANLRVLFESSSVVWLVSAAIRSQISLESFSLIEYLRTYDT